jgi:hypothetical protein
MYLSDKANFTYSSKQTLLLVRILFILHYSRKFYFTFGCGSLFDTVGEVDEQQGG